MRRLNRRIVWSSSFIALLLAAFIAIGIRGLDFGRHWDEPVLLRQYRYSIEHRLLLPVGVSNKDRPELEGGNYEYPSVLYWVGMASALPEIVQRGGSPSGPADFFTSAAFDLRLRRNCLLISSVLIVWVFIAARAIGRRWIGAVVAAGLVGGSWEFAYHSRFVATDTIMAEFAGLTLLLCLVAIRTTDTTWRHRWMIGAAVAAGLATGTKYPGGLLAAPVLIAGWCCRAGGPIRSFEPRHGRDARASTIASQVGWLAKLLAIQVGVFLLTTPGAVLQPWNFVAWLQYNRFHYGQAGHFGHTIRSHAGHLWAMLQYLSQVLFSPSPIVSGTVSCLCAIGAIRLLKNDRRIAAVLLAFPVLYVGYFSTQIVMIVRNLLVLLPFLAVLAAVGVDTLFDGLGRARGAWRAIGVWGLSAALTAEIAGSLLWLSNAAESIQSQRTEPAQLAAAREYLNFHPDMAVYPTERVAAGLGWPLVPKSTGGQIVVLSFAREDGDTQRWPANIRGFSIATFGPREVNFDYYPDWAVDRLVLIDLANARKAPVAQIERAVARYDGHRSSVEHPQ